MPCPRWSGASAPTTPGVMTGPGTNTYLIGVDEIAVIDPGPADEAHLDAVAGCGGDRIRWILLTHTHPDHGPGAIGLKERTGAKIMAFESRGRHRGGRHPGRRRHGRGHRVAPDGRPHARATPSNHLCFMLEEERCLFTGDHVMDGSTVVIKPPDGDMVAYLASLERIRAMRLSVLAPAHGHPIEDPKARDRLVPAAPHRAGGGHRRRPQGGGHGVHRRPGRHGLHRRRPRAAPHRPPQRLRPPAQAPGRGHGQGRRPRRDLDDRLRGRTLSHGRNTVATPRCDRGRRPWGP